MTKSILDGFSALPRWKDSTYMDTVALPQNTSTVSTVVNSGAGSKRGQDKIIAIAETAVTMTATNTITVTYEDSDDGATGWGALGTYTFTAPDTTPFAVGDQLFPDFFLPDQAKPYTRVTVATNDVAAVGSVSVFNTREPFNKL